MSAPTGSMNTMSAMSAADVPIEVLLDALRRFEQCLRGVAQDVTSRLSSPTRPVPPGPGAWRSVAALTSVSPATFLSPAARLAVCDEPLLLRVLAMRALYARGALVRRCVDRERLLTLRAAVGREAFTRLLAVAPVHGVSEPDWPADVTSQTLVADGLSRLRHPGGIDDPSLMPLLSLRLARFDGVPVHEMPGHAELARETTRFFVDLPSLLPEFV
ncbi:type III secretion protein HrpB4 [Pandoraea anhela]|nr:type III secretion protein HrpB4 [Pandoraea anhela]